MSIEKVMGIQDEIVNTAMSVGEMALPVLCCSLEIVCKKTGVSIFDVADMLKAVNNSLGETTC